MQKDKLTRYNDILNEDVSFYVSIACGSLLRAVFTVLALHFMAVSVDHRRCAGGRPDED